MNAAAQPIEAEWCNIRSQLVSIRCLLPLKRTQQTTEAEQYNYADSASKVTVYQILLSYKLQQLGQGNSSTSSTSGDSSLLNGGNMQQQQQLVEAVAVLGVSVYYYL